MNVSRREILKLSGLASAGLVGATTSVSAGDVDPRAEPVEGEAPNTNVPTTEVGAIPTTDGTVPAGDWIAHTNGWYSDSSELDECTIPELLNETTQVYTIDGEEFVFDSLDDWEFVNPSPDPGEICSANFAHVTPPKPPGTTYEVTWNVIGDEEKFPVINAFPFGNEIEVVGGRGKGKGNGK